MDTSTEGVTLLAGFIFDVLSEFKGREQVYAELFAKADGLDPRDPGRPVPMALYNEICDWVEKRLGFSAIRRTGQAIGARAYQQMVADGSLGKTPSPQQILRELKRVASLMIQDPKGRGWEIVDEQKTSIRMRRTQSFNCVLQEGLLVSLVEKTGVSMPLVRHDKCTRRGDEYCEYEVKYLLR